MPKRAKLAYRDQRKYHRRDVAADRTNESPERKRARLDSLRQRSPRRRAEERREREVATSTSHYPALRDHRDDQVPLYFVGRMSVICPHCSALHFVGEKTGEGFMACCHKGKVSLPPLRVPAELQDIFESNDRETRGYLENIRRYNNALAFISIGANIDPPPGHGPYCFRIHGQMHHYVGGLHHSHDSRSPSYASLYIMDARRALQERLSNTAYEGCSPTMMAKLQDLLLSVNPHVRLFQHAYEVEQRTMRQAANNNVALPSVRMFIRKTSERRYDDPRAEEIAAVFVAEEGEPPSARDLVVHTRREGLSTLPTTSPFVDPLAYPLLFPCGEFGFELDIPHNLEFATAKRRTVTMLQFYSSRLAVREGFSLIHSSGKLFQQYVVDSYLKVEANNLKWIRHNQAKLRVERYQGLMDHVNDVAQQQNVKPGRMVILPSSFSGSPRNMLQNFQDAMAVVAKYGKPDLFITFTCNPKWTEITDHLRPWEKVEHRPDLVARVFSLKLNELMRDLAKANVFGIAAGFMYVIEFQKRGLPHAHILVLLSQEHKIREAEQIDMAVCAEIPDRDENPRLHKIVKNCMIHGPCGQLNPSSPCMEDGLCTKSFPKDFADETEANVDGYPVYRRRDNGVSLDVGSVSVDNRWVVPYNPFLSLKYDAHINVEACTSIKAVKYLFKYVYKGYDRASVQIQQRIPVDNGEEELQWDEINTFLDARYVSAPEGMWRLLENRMHDQSHTIVRLAVHLPFQQNVCFAEGEEQSALDRASDANTTLTGWFALNASDERARDVLYKDIPTSYVWNKSQTKWTERKRGADKIIGRMYAVSPKDSERYYMRMLLLHVPGATSFEHLRSFEGVVYDTFREACIRRGLLEDDSEWVRCLEELCSVAMPGQLRRIFAYICAFCTPRSPSALFDQFCEFLYEDFLRTTDDVHISRNMALLEIHRVVTSTGMDFASTGLPVPAAVDLGALESSFDVEEERRVSEEMLESMTDEQRGIVDEVMQSIESEAGLAFFVDGPGGSGKTFLYSCLIHMMRARSWTVLPVAWTGMAANLLPGGRTAHSSFKLPFGMTSSSVSSISPNSIAGKQLREMKLIIWDEASMIPVHAVTVVNNLLQDVCASDSLFGGKTVVFGGDFRQVLPVVPHGNRTSIMEACLKRSPLWPCFQVRRLTVNMRAGAEEREFSDFLLRLGNGELPRHPDIGEDVIRLPDECILDGDLTSEVYGGGDVIDVERASERAILCPTNKDCDYLNSLVLGRMEGEETVYLSADSIDADSEEEKELYPPEFVNTLTPSGLPPHDLRLKVGSICVLLRNLNSREGLVNGCRLIVRRLFRNSFDAEVVSGESRGTRVIIPRINMTSTDPSMPFVIKRRQFPVRLAFAMTINKAQGQTFEKIGLYLPQPVFSHGQLYVALSRVRGLSDVKINVENTRRQGRFVGKDGVYTRNIIYEEALQ